MKQYVVPLICAALAACTGGDKAPEGQVAATVDGKEVTVSEVRAELGPLAGDPRAAAARQPDALQTVVNRKLLADAAVDRGLDKTPEGAMLLQKAHELALIQLLQDSLVRAVPKVGAAQAADYVRDNPALFAQRRIILLEQLAVPDATPPLVERVRKLPTIDAVAQLLQGERIAFRRGNDALDPLTLQPDMLRDILANGQKGVFVTPLPQGGAQVSRIAGFRDAPLAGEEANRAALAVLSQRQTGDQLRRQFEGIIADGQKDVKVNAAFRPRATASAPATAPATASGPAQGAGR